MAFNYAKSAVTAARLLAKFGGPVTIAAIAGASQDGTGVLLEYSTEEKGEYLKAGTPITAADRKLLLSVTGIATEPVPGHIATWQGIKYQVKQVSKLAPAGVTVMYELMVRR